MAGLVALGWDGLANHGELTWLGDAMFALGGLFWASYTIGSRVWRVEPLHATAVVGVLSMVLYIPGYAWLAGADLAAAPWREIVIQAVFQGVLSAIVALLLYTRAVAILGAARGAVFAALVPTFSLLIAIPLLHETPTQLQLVGVVFVTAGMVFALGLHDPAKWRRCLRGQRRDEVDHALALGLVRQAAARGRHVVDHVMRLARRGRHGRHGRMRRGELQEELRPRRRAELVGPRRHLVPFDAVPQSRAAERQIDEHARCRAPARAGRSSPRRRDCRRRSRCR